MNNPDTATADEPAIMAGQSQQDIIAENEALKKRVAELEQLVARDTLTPLFNRRHFMDVLDRWRVRAQRHDTNYGLIYIDVDGLKGINDSFGHHAGDELLITVAKVLEGNIRRFDVAARIGGDEFAVLLDDMDQHNVVKKMRALQKFAADHPLAFGDGNQRARISLGYTMVDPDKDAATLLSEADQHMYAQKRAGNDAQGA